MLFSSVIPIYNEEKILESSINDLHLSLTNGFPEQDWEIILVENGSSDKTFEISEKLSKKYDNVRVFHIDTPDYGKALKTGFLESKGKFVIGDEIDLGNMDFYRLSVAILENSDVDMVIGSKALTGAVDQRPIVRRFATKTINSILKFMFGIKGTDTHGLKAFKRDSMIDIIKECQTGRELFASEFVIRSERDGKNILEIPIRLREKRPPAIKLFKRVPTVISGLIELKKVLKDS